MADHESLLALCTTTPRSLTAGAGGDSFEVGERAIETDLLAESRD